MFHIPLNQITFGDVVNFCKTFREGVRAEYKREPTKHIPKIISSFANTVGGIWILGTEAEKVTNLPKLPLEGMKRAEGVQEQITQSAHMGIYPAITPDVRVLDIPDKPDRMLVVVKVPESIEAPHAIENSTKVYIRNSSTTDPYELAAIDRIEYFLKRRQEPERRREELIAQIAARSAYQGNQPRVRVVVAPVYPRGILLPPDELRERGEFLRSLRGQEAARFVQEFRLIHEGIMSRGAHAAQRQWHFEANVHGIVFYEAPGATSGIAIGRDGNVEIREPYVNLENLVEPLGSVLNAALVLLKGSVTNVLIRYELGGWVSTGFLAEDPQNLDNAGALVRSRMLDERRALVTGSVTTVLETLTERRATVITEIMRQVLWAFNYTSPDLSAQVYSSLRERQLI